MNPEERWKANVEWMDRSFEIYMQNQLAQGHTEAEALSRLKAIWDREDEERLQAIARIGKLTAEADRRRHGR